MRCTLVIPARGAAGRLCNITARLLAWLRERAAVFANEGVEILRIDMQAAVACRAETGERVPLSLAPGAPHAVVNVAFLLQDVPPFEALLAGCDGYAVAACASAPTDDLFGVCWSGGRASSGALWHAVELLCTTQEDIGAGLLDALGIACMVAPGGGDSAHSPTMDPGAGVARRASDAPIYLNAAFEELLAAPATASSDGVTAELVALRARSRVPWIFNAILSDVEHRQGMETVASLPPEVHLSSTGLCNLECRFCAYTHANAHREFVTPEQVRQLDFLHWVQTLRLSSGLGEPTLNRHLPEIIGFLAARFPHLALNFFTNGVALHRPGLVPALLDAVRWINVSLNAATASSWRIQHQANLFDKVRANLVLLRDAKREHGCLLPVVHGSMVVNGQNLQDLPRMPALCRELGVDRLSAFPYSSLGYDSVGHTFGPDQALERVRDRYDALYEATVASAREHRVSLELPRRAHEKSVRFGLEQRVLHDFAGIERNDWRVSALGGVLVDGANSEHCAFLWRFGCIGSTHRGSRATESTHYMYPCIGPLASADLSLATAFRFPDRDGMTMLWNHRVFQQLRRAQSQCGVSPVCDHCRGRDSRDPAEFDALQRLVAEFTAAADAFGNGPAAG